MNEINELIRSHIFSKTLGENNQLIFGYQINPKTMFFVNTKVVTIHGIIEGDQIQVATFSLDYFLNLTRSPWANENASINNPKAGLLIKNEQHYWACVFIGPG